MAKIIWDEQGLIVVQTCNRLFCIDEEHRELLIHLKLGVKDAGMQSKYKNVCWSIFTRKWSVRITYKGVHYRGGDFFDEDEAGQAAIELRKQIIRGHQFHRQS